MKVDIEEESIIREGDNHIKIDRSNVGVYNSIFIGSSWTGVWSSAERPAELRMELQSEFLRPLPNVRRRRVYVCVCTGLTAQEGKQCSGIYLHRISQLTQWRLH